MQEEEDEGLPEGYKWESRGQKRVVIPSEEKAGGRKQIQISDAKQLKRLHKDGRFIDLKPEHMLKPKKPLSAIRAAGGGGEPGGPIHSCDG